MYNSISSLFSAVLPGKLRSSNKTPSGLDKPATTPQTAEDKFMAYAKMSPADKLRAGILSGLGLPEDQVKNMSPDQRKDVEQKIADQIKQAAQKQAEKSGNGGFFTDMRSAQRGPSRCSNDAQSASIPELRPQRAVGARWLIGFHLPGLTARIAVVIGVGGISGAPIIGRIIRHRILENPRRNSNDLEAERALNLSAWEVSYDEGAAAPTSPSLLVATHRAFATKRSLKLRF